MIFERILVAVDGSKHSDAAFELATKMAQKVGSQLFVLHVFQGGTGTTMFVVQCVEYDLRSIGQDILASYERKLQEEDL